MKTQKFCALLLVVIIFAGSLSACHSNSGSRAPSEPASVELAAVTQETVITAPAATQTPAPTPDEEKPPFHNYLSSDGTYQHPEQHGQSD